LERKVHFFSCAYAVIFYGFLRHAKHLRNFPAWHHFLGERAYAQLHRCELGVLPCERLGVAGARAAARHIGLLPEEMPLSARFALWGQGGGMMVEG